MIKNIRKDEDGCGYIVMNCGDNISIMISEEHKEDIEETGYKFFMNITYFFND